jgi:hypothetical protein
MEDSGEAEFVRKLQDGAGQMDTKPTMVKFRKRSAAERGWKAEFLAGRDGRRRWCGDSSCSEYSIQADGNGRRSKRVVWSEVAEGTELRVN